MIFGPTIDEDDSVIEITYAETVWHYISMPWRLLFSVVPPRRFYGGWPAFVASLIMIGVITFFITEVVEAGGCLMDMRACV